LQSWSNAPHRLWSNVQARSRSIAHDRKVFQEEAGAAKALGKR